MKKAITLLALISALTTAAQEVVATQGDSYSNTSTQIDFTIGEIIINTGTDGTNELTQGFHQTNWNFVGLENHATGYEASIFPNPTSDMIYIKTLNTIERIELFDILGKQILSIKNKSEIDVSSYQSGIYLLKVKTDKGQITKKIVKE